MLLAPAGESKRSKRYFPFAEGPRNCVGQSLAKVSLVATMATLLQHFHFKLADEVSHHQNPTTVPRRNINIIDHDDYGCVWQCPPLPSQQTSVLSQIRYSIWLLE